MLNYLWPVSLTWPDTCIRPQTNACFSCNFSSISRKCLVSVSRSLSSSSCGFSSPSHHLACSSLNRPLKGEMEGAGEWCRRRGRGVPICACQRCHIPPCFCPTCSPQLWNKLLQRGSPVLHSCSQPAQLHLYNTFFTLSHTSSFFFHCKAPMYVRTVCSSCLGHDTSKLGRIFHESISAAKSRVLPGFGIMSSTCRVDVINCVASLDDPIQLQLDRPADSESCGCNLQYKAERRVLKDSVIV